MERQTPGETPAGKQPRGIVIATFYIQEQDIAGLLDYTAAAAGPYAAVMWHNRKRPRIERADELRKVGSLNDW